MKSNILSLMVSGMVIASATGAPSAAAEEKPVVVIETSLGQIEVELEPGKAPETVKNFLDYVDSKFYDGTIFHRVIKGFMIQGGGFTPEMQQKKTNPSIKIESSNGLKNTRGTIAMARTMDPNSATSQFFINHVDNDFLNYRDSSVQGAGYTVFGHVSKGIEVVDKIASVGTTTKAGMQDVPAEAVLIKSIRQKGK